MIKSKVFLFLLFAVAIAKGTQFTSTSLALTIESSRTTPSTAQFEQLNETVELQPDSTSSQIVPWSAGLAGGLLFSLFLHRIYEKQRQRNIRQTRKIDRFKEEFLCGPLADYYASNLEKLVTAQVTETSSEEAHKSVDSSTAESSDADTLSISLSSHYRMLIDRIVNEVLKKQIRSPEFIYQQLTKELNPDTNEIFETCLVERLNDTQSRLNRVEDTQQLFSRENPEIERARLTRQLRALHSLQGAWERWQKENRSKAAVAAAAEQIRSAAPNERLSTLIQVMDANQAYTLTLAELQQLAKSLEQAEESGSELTPGTGEIHQLALGITRGLQSYQQLEDHLVRWLYEPTASQTGGVGGNFNLALKQRDPWAFWARRVNSPLLQELFQVLAHDESVITFATRVSSAELGIWTELLVTLQFLQRGMVRWFEQQPYDSKWGTASCIATFLTFACVWCQLCNGVNQATPLACKTRELLSKDCLQVTLQIIRTFSHQPYFPLYGGVFALFSRDALQDALNYLDEPLQKVEGTQEKARFLTLLGYSQQFIGQGERATAFHQQALEIARSASDRACEIANLNHLSRVCVTQKNYTEAINYCSRALVLARQVGDRLGEANALVNLGYSEVLRAQQLERLDSETYETAIDYLQRGRQLSQQLGDRQSQAICCNSLGIAHLIVQQPHTAVSYLQEGAEAARASGDLHLQGLNFAYLAEAYYALNHLEQAAYNAFLAMYLLERISAKEWQQPAGLLVVIQGQVEAETFQQFLMNHQSEFVTVIGVDGYDYLLQLLEKYKQQ